MPIKVKNGSVREQVGVRNLNIMDSIDRNIFLNDPIKRNTFLKDSIKRIIFQANPSANRSLCGNLNSQVWITDIMMLNNDPYNCDGP